MKILLFLLLTILLIVLLHHLTTTTLSPPIQPPSPAFVVHFSETPSQHTVPLQQNHQLNKIIDALIGAVDFAGWANILSSTDPSTLPITATLFIPTNDAIAKAANSTGIFLPDTFLIPYHIVPQRFSFDDLRKCPVFTKLPTLLPTKFIVITNDSVENFTVDGTRVTHPDLYLTGSFSVHGVMNVLDYVVFGNVQETVNGTLAKNETTIDEKKEPVKGDDIVVVSYGSWLVCDIWISVVVCMLLWCIIFIWDLSFSDHAFWLVVVLMLAYITDRM